MAAVAVVIVAAGAAIWALTDQDRSSPPVAASPAQEMVASTTITTVAGIATYASPADPTAVGVRSYTFDDVTRPTEARGDRPALPDRPLTVTVRYPTEGMAGRDELDDAPEIAPAPLVLFAHGFDVSSSRYAELLHDIAAAGFVVVAPEFPMSSTVFDGAPDEYDLPEQSRDLSFLISAITSSDAPAELRAMVLPGPVGVIGHSDGAVTALLAAFSPRFDDSRIGAVIAASGDFDTFGGEWFSQNDPPLLAVHGEYDELNPIASSEELVDADPGPAMLVTVAGASHLGSVTDPANAPSVARLMAWFLRWRLLATPGAESATMETADTAPLSLLANHP